MFHYSFPFISSPACIKFIDLWLFNNRAWVMGGARKEKSLLVFNLGQEVTTKGGFVELDWHWLVVMLHLGWSTIWSVRREFLCLIKGALDNGHSINQLMRKLVEPLITAASNEMGMLRSNHFSWKERQVYQQNNKLVLGWKVYLWVDFPLFVHCSISVRVGVRVRTIVELDKVKEEFPCQFISFKTFPGLLLTDYGNQHYQSWTHRGGLTW